MPETTTNFDVKRWIENAKPGDTIRYNNEQATFRNRKGYVLFLEMPDGSIKELDIADVCTWKMLAPDDSNNDAELVRLARQKLQLVAESKGQDNCWYNPVDLLGLMKLFGVEPPPKEDRCLPGREEFELGCRRYQDELYGPPDMLDREAVAQRERDALRQRSGNITTDRKLVSFLYELMRDHLTPGKVEALVSDSQNTPVKCTNGFLAQYAADLADRLE